MALRDKVRANAEQYLQPGEQIQAVFLGQTVSPYYIIISYWILLAGGYRGVVVTDRRILVFKSGKQKTSALKEPLRELPRTTQIGPAKGIWFKIDLGERIYVHKRFHKDIAEADAWISAKQTPPPSPAPMTEPATEPSTEPSDR
jgi:hypothetical protein